MGDDAVTTTALAVTCPVLLAPAMNTRMWQNPVVQENLAALTARGWHVVGPGAGELADGDVGEGRLAEPAEIAVAASRLLGNLDLSGRRVVVTAGPTREPIDPVRFISNPSSGKMGYALAAVAARRGAEVVLVSGPTVLPDPPGCRTIRVETAEEMARAVDDVAGGHGPLHRRRGGLRLPARAVGAPHKVKKGAGDETLKLTRTPDILAGLGARLGGRPDAPVLVGFAAETEEVIARAREKLKGKRCDLVVANKVGGAGVGFGSDTNRVALVSSTELAEIEGPKERVAEAIVDWILPVLDARRPRAAPLRVRQPGEAARPDPWADRRRQAPASPPGREHQRAVDGAPEGVARLAHQLVRLDPGEPARADLAGQHAPQLLRHGEVALAGGVGARRLAVPPVEEQAEDGLHRQLVHLLDEVVLERQAPRAGQRQAGDVLEALHLGAHHQVAEEVARDAEGEHRGPVQGAPQELVVGDGGAGGHSPGQLRERRGRAAGRSGAPSRRGRCGPCGRRRCSSRARSSCGPRCRRRGGPGSPRRRPSPRRGAPRRARRSPTFQLWAWWTKRARFFPTTMSAASEP